MATDWRISGIDVTTCNCAWGCPCQFMSLPTQGKCEAALGFHVIKGHFGKTTLDGLSFGALTAWPGPIHFGNGAVLPIIDVRANDAQREALLKIMTGQETEPGATIFNVFAATFSKVHDPQFRRIVVEADFAKRTARIEAEGLVDSRVEPIRNPVTNEVSLMRITMPQGFEFEHAEVASCTVRSLKDSPIPLQWEGRHAHICRLEMTNKGVIHPQAAA
jgi:hypothetical protein